MDVGLKFQRVNDTRSILIRIRVEMMRYFVICFIRAQLIGSFGFWMRFFFQLGIVVSFEGTY